jgi:hypothetical protein
MSYQRYGAPSCGCALLHVCFVTFIVGGAAYAQSGEQPSTSLLPKDRTIAAAPNKETPEQIKERGRAWFRQCMEDWDIATHMTKVEWERTCRRVATERTKFLMDQPR